MENRDSQQVEQNSDEKSSQKDDFKSSEPSPSEMTFEAASGSSSDTDSSNEQVSLVDQYERIANELEESIRQIDMVLSETTVGAVQEAERDAKLCLVNARSILVSWGCDIRIETHSLDHIRNTGIALVLQRKFNSIARLLLVFRNPVAYPDREQQSEILDTIRSLRSFINTIRMSQAVNAGEGPLDGMFERIRHLSKQEPGRDVAKAQTLSIVETASPTKAMVDSNQITARGRAQEEITPMAEFKAILKACTIQGAFGQSYILVEKFKTWLKSESSGGVSQTERLFYAVYGAGGKIVLPISMDQVWDSLLVFSILIDIRYGHLIDHFHSRQITDGHLPIELEQLQIAFRPLRSPDAIKLAAERFHERQFAFCPDFPISDFQAKLEECSMEEVGGRRYVLAGKLKKYLKNEETPRSPANRAALLLENIYRKDGQVVLPALSEQVCGDRTCSLLVFSILFEIGHGRLIEHFLSRRMFDSQLPIDFRSLLTLFEDLKLSDAMTLAKDFDSRQWAFCPVKFDLHQSLSFGGNQIIPICQKEMINTGSKTSVYQITVQEEFVEKPLRDAVADSWFKDDSDGFGSVSPLQATRLPISTSHIFFRVALALSTQQRYQFALKVFDESHKYMYHNEVRAFRALGVHDRIVRYLTDYVQIDQGNASYNILLEYGELDLDEFFGERSPPFSRLEILDFWNDIFEVADAVKHIHNFERYRGDERQEYCGWHADIKPSNILSVQGKFKLADLAWVQFVKKTDLDENITFSGGTRSYGPPECFHGSLPIPRAIDIWSLGCVFSLAATWLVLGFQGILQFNKVRERAIEKIVQQQSSQSASGDGKVGLSRGDFFHGGDDVLDDVTSWHTLLRSAMRRLDTVTGQVLDLVDQEMLLGTAIARINAVDLCTLLDGISSRSRVEPGVSLPTEIIARASLKVDEDSLSKPVDVKLAAPTAITARGLSFATSGSRVVHNKPQNVFQVRADLERRQRGLFRKRIEEYDESIGKCLGDRAIKFLVDNAETMEDFWDEATFLLETLAMKLKSLDKNGMDLSFTGGKNTLYNLRKPSALKEAMEDPRIKPVSGVRTDMRKSLGDILEDFGRFPEHETLVVLTDGKWQGMGANKYDVDELIIKFLKDQGKVAEKLTIQFIQFGDDVDATFRLRRLDNDLIYSGVPDIVDTESSRGDINKMLLGSIVKFGTDEDEQISSITAIGRPPSISSTVGSSRWDPSVFSVGSPATHTSPPSTPGRTSPKPEE